MSTNNLTKIVSPLVISIFILGCSGTNANQAELKTQASNLDGEQCEPGDGYDSCWRNSIDQMRQWEETLPDPEWRTVDVDSGTQRVEIHINARKLNNGFVRIPENAGVYESESEFNHAQRKLLGITQEQQETFDVFVSQTGTTQRLRVDEAANSVTYPDSSGSFMVDWLLTDDLTLIIDGEEIDPEMEQFSLVDAQSTSTSGQMSTQSSGLTLSSGNWSVDYTGGRNDALFYQLASSNLKNFERNGKSTTKDCAFLGLFCETHHVKADEMKIEHRYYDSDYGYFKFDSGANGSDVDSLRHSWLTGGDIGPICYRSEVVDGGMTDDAIAGLGTDFFEVDCSDEF